MKKVLLSTLLAIVAILISGSCIFYVISVSDKATMYVEKIKSDAENDDFEHVITNINQLSDFWESNHTLLSIILHHEILENIEESIAVIKSSAETQPQSENSDFQMEIEKLSIRLKNFREVEIPSIGNIL